ncbi:MAG TPA: heat-inducible transcriptional repressor HrcA [Actinomycetota bacterium]|nr:heat-inducible transcriptional repressor HrcA [Actinomycetota bacterium]
MGANLLGMQTRSPLDKRKASILRAVVREYVRTGQPVGSKTLAQRYRLKVSAATIRNDMAVLEELGSLSQPYTSAGRIPSDMGYRWFVDNWPGTHWPGLPDRAQAAIDGMMRSDFAGIEEVLDSSSHMLSDLTEATAVAVAPPAKTNRLRRIELLRRDPKRATLLLIADNGVVEQTVIEFPTERSEVQLADITKRLDKKLQGVAFEDLPTKVLEGKAVDDDSKRVAVTIQQMVAEKTENKIFRGGTANILSPDKFADLATAHSIVDALEQPPILSSLIDTTRASGTVLVFIGQEVPIEQMRACAVIFAPYDAGGERTGSIGVIGPTRMDYPHTISAVEAVARSLSQLFDGTD